MSDAELDRRVLLGAAGIVGMAALTRIGHAGPLSPPGGPVGATPGPEPRTVINSTNTPGDGGSVYKITQPGNYVLAQDVVGESGKHGILIALPMPGSVSIDLRGFSLRGGPGSLNGIEFGGTGASSFTFQNGLIFGWGGSGINGAPGSGTILGIIGVLIALCTADGIRVAPTASAIYFEAKFEDILISSCRDGISIGGTRNNAIDSIAITNCSCQRNARHGFNLDGAFTNSRFTWDPKIVCSGNAGDGIRIAGSVSGGVATMTLADFESSSNTGRGIGWDVVLSANAQAALVVRNGVVAGNFIGVEIAGSANSAAVSVSLDRVVGDWNGDGVDTIGVLSNARVSMRMSACSIRGSSSRGIHMAPTGNGFFDVFYGDLDIANCGQAGISAQFPAGVAGAIDSTGVTVRNCGSGGLVVSGAADVVLRDCTFTGNTGNGATIGPGAKECTVTGCHFSSNSGNGFRFESPGSGPTSTGCFRIENSVFRRSGVAGASIESCRGGEIVRSTFTSGDVGVALGAGAVGVTLDGCTAANNSSGGFTYGAAGNLMVRCTARSNGAGGGDHVQAVAGNTIGPFVTAANIATSPNPHANYSH